MMAYIYIFALFFFTICNGQETSWTGAGGSNNNTITNPLNWSNGLPTTTSIVYVNNTSPSVTIFDLLFDEDTTIAELHINSTSPTINIFIVGAKLTVTGAFTLGNSYASPAWIYVKISGGGSFEIGPDCTATIYPIYSSSASILGNDEGENWFINKGIINFVKTDTGSSNTVVIGSSSDTQLLYIDSWGTWDVTDTQVQVQFYYVKQFNVYSGSILGTWIDTDTVSIQYYQTDFVLQDGAGGDATTTKRAAGDPVVIEYIQFYSVNYQYTSDYSPYYITSVVFNTTGVTISNSQFDRTNINFVFDGWLDSCNLTDNVVVNSTGSGAHAYFTGDSTFGSDIIFSGLDSSDFIIQIEDGGIIHLLSAIYFFGPVTIINNGTYAMESWGYNHYWDLAATFVNLGLIDVQDLSHYIYGSSFPGLTTATEIGTIYNMGTIQFTTGGYVNFNAGSGTFRQCKHGIVKFDYTDSAPGSVVLPEVYFSGALGALFPDDYTIYSSGDELFTWSKPTDILPYGNVDLVVKGPFEDVKGVSVPVLLILCFDKATTSATIFKLTDGCPDNSYPALLPFVSGDACSGDETPDNIKNLQDSASCPSGQNCGVDTGAPAGEDGTTSTANVSVASLAFIVSLVCLLLKF